MSQELIDRNQQMYLEKLEGATYRELAIKYQLTIERVFKIVKKEKLRKAGLLERYRKDKRI